MLKYIVKLREIPERDMVYGYESYGFGGEIEPCAACASNGSIYTASQKDVKILCRPRSKEKGMVSKCTT